MTGTLGISTFTGNDFFVLRGCTTGLRPVVAGPTARGVSGFNGPYWGNLTIGIAYVVVASYVALTRRAL